MAEKSGVRIAGTGMFVPPKVVTNDDLAKVMDTSDEWIQQRTGIKERRHVEDGTNPSDLAFAASKKALESAQIKASDIDMIIVATLSPEHFFPGTSVFLQRKLGLETTPAMDLRCQCSGFLYALQTGASMIAAGTYKKILVCGVEVHSRALDFTTRGRDVSVLFGDGAGAIVLEETPPEENNILHTALHAQGEFAERLWMPFPSMTQSPLITTENIEDGSIWPKMDGRYVFKHAVRRMPEVLHEALSATNLQPNDIDHYLFHQANLRINEAVLQHLDQPKEKAPINIDRYGNCSAASIPILLDENVRNEKIKRGDLICLTSFGSGFTWGSAIIRW